MKVIDLLNKIANREKVPEKIKWFSTTFIYDKNELDYFNDNNLSLFRHDEDYNITKMLNDKVEIIEDTPKEDKKIEKLIGKDKGYYIDYSTSNIVDKINEIIDKVNGEK